MGLGSMSSDDASSLFGPGFRSEPDLKSSHTRTLIFHNRNLENPHLLLKLDINIHVQAFPAEFNSSSIKGYTTGIIILRVTHSHLPHLPHCS